MVVRPPHPLSPVPAPHLRVSLSPPLASSQVSMVRSAAAGLRGATMLPWVAPEILRHPEFVTGKVVAVPPAYLGGRGQMVHYRRVVAWR